MSNSTVLDSPGADTLLPVTDEILNCKLVGGFSIFVQLLVGTLGFSTLIIKRHFERPRRPWLVWGFDVGKQMISGTIMHMCNLLVSALSGGEAGEDATNPCSWYVLNLTLDCTLGVLFVAGYLKLFETIAVRYKITGLESGHYGDPPRWQLFVRQALVFCASMLCMKFTVVIMAALFPFLVAIGDLILKPVQLTHSPHFQIIFVMAIWPLVLNIFESWVIDQFIKKKHRGPVMSATGHIPLSMDESAPPYTASIEMQNTLSDSRTLDNDDMQMSMDMSEFELDEHEHRKRPGTDAAYHDQPFALPTPAFTPTEARISTQRTSDDSEGSGPHARRRTQVQE
ncbi:hypothetical protein LPJ63_004298 [Coemansia sp. RSA 2711]|nr:hypothetical protein LPJ63_004298 [Coemansia sp. RSA 2711]KAJ2304999.1 hypothetical protein IWW54_005216 [Coemansia sp. RSA 2705]KAJ2322779.1 hypothetical protein IWW51_004075 [Coemansia sp. RSA 2702]